MSEERGLTDAAPTPEPEIPDTEIIEQDNPAQVSIRDIAHGLRGVSAKVTVHDPMSLAEVAHKIDSYPTDDDVPDELVDRFVAAKALFEKGETLTIEGWGPERIALLYAEMSERLGGEPSKDTPTADLIRRSMKMDAAQFAAQIVSHAKTAEWVAGLREAAPGEYHKIEQAIAKVNTMPAKALMPDFSRRATRLSRRGAK